MATIYNISDFPRFVDEIEGAVEDFEMVRPKITEKVPASSLGFVFEPQIQKVIQPPIQKVSPLPLQTDSQSHFKSSSKVIPSPIPIPSTPKRPRLAKFGDRVKMSPISNIEDNSEPENPNKLSLHEKGVNALLWAWDNPLIRCPPSPIHEDVAKETYDSEYPTPKSRRLNLDEEDPYRVPDQHHDARGLLNSLARTPRNVPTPNALDEVKDFLNRSKHNFHEMPIRGKHFSASYFYLRPEDESFYLYY